MHKAPIALYTSRTVRTSRIRATDWYKGIWALAEDKEKSSGVQQDNLDQFRTRRKSEIVSNLVDLSRSVEPLTILFESGKHSFPTSIIGLNEDHTEVIFERAGSEEMNKKILGLKKGTVVGQPEGVKLRFLLEQIRADEYEGEKVFVAPLPTEHYRMQRRRFFRIPTLISAPIKVTLTMPNEETVTLNAGNISSGGLRLDDVDNVLACKTNQAFENCLLEIPDVEPFPIALQVRYSYEKVKGRKKGSSVHYVGCIFLNLNANQQHEIQKYINTLQMEQRALAK